MTKKQLLVVLWIVVLGLVIGPMFYLQHLPTPLQSKYARVRRGMTVEEVHAILGKPYWATNTPIISHGSMIVEIRVDEDSPDVANWVFYKEEYSDPGSARLGPSFTAYVFFANGRVTRKEYVQGDRPWPKVFQSFFDLIGQ